MKKEKKTLIKKYYQINQVKFGEKTKIEGYTLFLKPNIIDEAFELSNKEIVLETTLNIITPKDYENYIDTILDVQPLAVKDMGNKVGEGVTRSLSGVVLVISGKDEAGEQISEAGSVEESFEHMRNLGKPKVLLVKEIMGQGAMHEKLLLPLQPCGITGAHSNIDMGNVPIMVSPIVPIGANAGAPNNFAQQKEILSSALINLVAIDEPGKNVPLAIEY